MRTLVLLVACSPLALAEFVYDSPSPCTMYVRQASSPDNFVYVDLAADPRGSVIWKVKTFAHRVGESDTEDVFRVLDELAKTCKAAETTLAGRAGKGRSEAAAARPLIRPTHQWIVEDFNGDGRADSIVPSSNALFIQLGQITGLTASRRVVLGPSTHGYAAGAATDLNGDGRPDLVLCCSGLGAASRLVTAINNGDATFQAPVESIPATGPFALVDWNGDGVQDVVTATPSGSLTIARGAAGGFQVAHTVTVAAQSLVVGDFTGDRIPDVLILTATGVSVLPGRPDGSLGAGLATELPFQNPNTVVAADFNSDGALDVAVFDTRSGVMAMLMGDNSGRFRVTGLVATGQMEAATAFDIDEDGLLELILPSAGAGVIQIAPVFPDGTVGASPLYRLSPTSAAGGVAVADFDNDGKADLALGGIIGSDPAVRVFRGSTALKRLNAADPVVLRASQPSGLRIDGLAAADFNGDGLADLAVLDSAGRSLIPLRGKGDGTFDAGAAVATGASSVSQLLVGDWNGDGRPDAAVSGEAGVRIFTTSANGTFGAPAVAAPTFGSVQLAAGDLNGDGKLDLVFSGFRNGSSQCAVLLNNGSGAFGQPQELDVPSDAGINTIAVADLNRDGRADILLGGVFLVQNNYYFLAVYLANSAGGYTRLPLQREIDFGTSSMLIRDLNGDGTPDLLAAHCCGEATTRYYLGKGDGTFNASSVFPTPHNTSKIWLADFNGDGTGELVALNTAGVSLTPFRLPTGCAYNLASGSADFPASGGSSSVAVTVSSGCPWTATSNATWITITQASTGSGNGAVSYSVAPNSGPARAGTLTIGGRTFTVTQAGTTGCASVAPLTADFAVAGGQGSATVTAPAGCAWAATSNASWIGIAAGAAGSGSGAVVFSVGANTGAARTGTLTIAGQTFTVTQAGTGSVTGGLVFVPITPCRVADTRPGQGKSGAFGPPALGAGVTRNIPVPSSTCGIPSTALAYSLNVTVVPGGPLGYLTLWPGGQAQPLVSTLNSPDGSVVANAAIAPAGSNGSVSVFATNPTDLVLDINGYFVAAGAVNGLAFYPVTPCRVADTRPGQGFAGLLGPPSLPLGETLREFPVLQSNCGIPALARAYSLNVTVVPTGRLGYLTAFPWGQPRPLASTLNSWEGRVLANAAIIPSGVNGSIGVFTALESGTVNDVVIDVNGYFAEPGGPGALHFHPIAPCRVADTRPAQGTTGQFGPPSLPLGDQSRSFPLPAGRCNIPASARAYSVNITVVPVGRLGYLTAWQTGLPKPLVSTLNSWDGRIVSNAAIVPAGQSGAVSINTLLESGTAVDVILDINGYFASPN